MVSRGVGLGRGRFTQQPTQVDEGLLRREALLQFGGAPLGDEVGGGTISRDSRKGASERVRVQLDTSKARSRLTVPNSVKMAASDSGWRSAGVSIAAGAGGSRGRGTEL